MLNVLLIHFDTLVNRLSLHHTFTLNNTLPYATTTMGDRLDPRDVPMQTHTWLIGRCRNDRTDSKECRGR